MNYGYFQQAGTSPFERWGIAGLVNATALTTGAPAKNTLIVLPFVPPQTANIDQIAINVTTSAVNSSARIGIYEATNESNIYPDNLLFDSGSIATSSTGIKTATISPALNITKGKLLWIAYICGTNAPTLRSLAVAGCYPIFGIDSSMGTALGVGLTVSFTFAALPSTFPAGASILTAVPIPAIAIRIS